MDNILTVRALKIVQGENTRLYSFFLRGGDILKISDISRIRKDEEGSLLGYQRGEVLKHVNEIADYLGTKNVIFPNALLFTHQTTSGSSIQLCPLMLVSFELINSYKG